MRRNIPFMESCESRACAETQIRLFLLAEQALFRASLGRLLALEPDFEMAGECATSTDVLESLVVLPVDVVLLEYDPDSGHARELLLAATRSRFPGRFCVITASTDPRDWARMLRLGVSGIFLKSDSVDRLIRAIRTIASGEMWIEARVIRILAERYPIEAERIETDGLTDREEKVLLGIISGLSNRKIGEGLRLSESSVKAVVQQLFDKTGVRTRSQLVRIAISRSIHALPSPLEFAHAEHANRNNS